MAWFESTFGLSEEGRFSALQSVFRVEADVDGDISGAQRLIAPNGRVFPIGAFEAESLRDIRAHVELEATNHPPGVLYSIHGVSTDIC